ncbi:MAG: EexN family lipoprotein [Methyloglobulus sp.]|nr:EexN family lipoprotein [Methyloglobulus sp.]
MNTNRILLPLAVILGIPDRSVLIIKLEIKQEPTYHVAYYKANREDMKSTTKECANNLGEKGSSPNCKCTGD